MLDGRWQRKVWRRGSSYVYEGKGCMETSRCNCCSACLLFFQSESSFCNPEHLNRSTITWRIYCRTLNQAFREFPLMLHMNSIPCCFFRLVEKCLIISQQQPTCQNCGDTNQFNHDALSRWWLLEKLWVWLETLRSSICIVLMQLFYDSVVSVWADTSLPPHYPLYLAHKVE